MIAVWLAILSRDFAFGLPPACFPEESIRLWLPCFGSRPGHGLGPREIRSSTGLRPSPALSRCLCLAFCASTLADLLLVRPAFRGRWTASDPLVGVCSPPWCSLAYRNDSPKTRVSREGARRISGKLHSFKTRLWIAPPACGQDDQQLCPAGAGPCGSLSRFQARAFVSRTRTSYRGPC